MLDFKEDHTDLCKKLAQELNIRPAQAEAAVRLIDEGNTIPFIARYRKEATGELNDEVLRNLDERLKYLRSLEERKTQVMESISAQGKLTNELRTRIEAAETLTAVEDLYLPYRPKRRTRAMIAKEKGLQGLADALLAQDAGLDPEAEAVKYVDPAKEVNSAAEALAGARDIIAESVSEDAQYRAFIRTATLSEGSIVTAAREKGSESVYEMYYDYREALKKIPGHRVLAINRGESEKALTVKIEAPEEKILYFLERRIIRNGCGDAVRVQLLEAVRDSYKRLLAPAIEREIRNALTESAEDGAIKVFGKNLEQLLMQPPISGKVVLGWDPAFRTGCKLAVLDATGKVLDTIVIYPTEPQKKIAESKKILKALIAKYHVELISLGNGTASRESEAVIVELLKEIDEPVQYVIVNEAGASVYSASKLATEEFPNFDVGQRSAASIARRLQDPLAELVKIDPKSIGVGQYQHDMNQKKLDETLTAVVEDCVNRVGVDLNTASVSLLEYISGITKTLAKNIVAYRDENGSFKSRKELLNVPKLGAKAFEQSAGFMRINGGIEPLDATAVHPESYAAAEQLLHELGCTKNDIGRLNLLSRKAGNAKLLAEKLGIGEITLRDLLSELEKPARDPRDEMPKPILRTDVLEMNDLKEGMILRGTVRNVIDFGVFVDIGVHQDGLVHISQLSGKKFVRHPLEVVSVGDVVDVKVLSVDPRRKRISLTMILE